MQRKYQTVKDMFENHFVKCRNKNSRAGRACRRLYCCSLCLCQYGNLREETIWDQIVVGILDGCLEKLKLDPELTLEKAVTQARQSKAVKKQQGTVHEGNAEQPPANAPAGVDESEGLQQDRESLWCQHVAGVGEVHPTLSSSGQAREATCNKCHKKGHFQSMCRSKRPVQIRYVQLVSKRRVKPTKTMCYKGTHYTLALLLRICVSIRKH